MIRPLRSLLYVPASRPAAMAKAASLACDGVILDLEDAVAPAAKANAREALSRAIDAGFGDRLALVRVNAPGGVVDAADVAASAGADALLLPKVENAAVLNAAAALTDLPLWVMIETPPGVLNAAAICAHPRVAGVILGSNDLVKDLRARDIPGRAPILTAMSLVVLAARAHGRAVIDGVCNAYLDLDRLAAECAQARDMGFDGKSLIHPAQIPIANATFAPDAAEVELARRQIAAHEAALAAGQGVATLDGRIVEALHVETARATLALAAAIAAR